MNRKRSADAAVWRRLATADGQDRAAFDPATLDGLPAPAARWLRHAVPIGSPIVDAVVVSMTGSIKLGPRWMPFTAEQVLRAGVGFVWRPVVGGRVLRFTGADALGPDGGRLEFRLHGLVPVASASGPDTTRSAVGRLAAETVAWLPQAVTPQAGARWRPVDEDRAIVALVDGAVDDAGAGAGDGAGDGASDPVEVEITVDREGRLVSIDLQRWNDSVKPPRFDAFGADVTGEFRTDDGVVLAGSADVGWGHRTPRWPDGEFFRYTLTVVTPIR